MNFPIYSISTHTRWCRHRSYENIVSTIGPTPSFRPQNTGTHPETTERRKNTPPQPRSNSPNGPNNTRNQTPKGGSGLPPSPLESPLATVASAC